ncbi:uncharacterized protein G2W53_042927 [Senna tora]|uniref:Uncharacterized protein n=1 Tax=Senna tora TaxID=362788 RepID=A0A834SI22_9FABA|nr:uncharacterized protein G2W53_042927 [Senna tora]
MPYNEGARSNPFWYAGGYNEEDSK